MRDQVISILRKTVSDSDLNSNRLIDDKIIDSLSLVTIVSDLSVAFGVRIKVTDLKPENFNSVDAIVSLVSRLQGK